MGEVLTFLLFGALVWWLVATGARIYNTINPLKHSADEAEANIEVVMHKRVNLSQRLVAIAERYAGHEKLIHIHIADSFSAGRPAQSPFAQSKNAVAVVAGLAMQYPALKADQTYLRLMDDISSLDSQLQSKYEQYNNVAKSYNALRASFPAVLFSSFFGFEQLRYLDPTMWYPRGLPRGSSQLRVTDH